MRQHAQRRDRWGPAGCPWDPESPGQGWPPHMDRGNGGHVALVCAARSRDMDLRSASTMTAGPWG